MHKEALVAFVMAGIAMATLQPVVAQTTFRSQWRKCLKSNGQARIAACTWLLGSGKLTPNQRPRIYFYRGHEYDKSSSYSKAVADYTEVLKARLSPATTYNNRGNAYRHLKAYQKAIDDFNQAIRLNPRDALAFNNWGVVYSILKQYRRVISDYDQAISLDPRFANAYHNRGSVYRDLKQNRKAIADYKNALKLNPKDEYSRKALKRLGKTP